MLACARIGAVHSVVFGGFSAEALRDRIKDCNAEVVITQDEGKRGGKPIPLKATVDAACEGESIVKKVLVYQHTKADVDMTDGRDVWWHETVAKASAEHTLEAFDADRPRR
jgi:acetyl-CoA synthetase